jgi:hypothetical protein
MSLIAVGNLVAWLRRSRRYARGLSEDERAAARVQLVLSGVYVAVCAFRSFLPRADVQRICFVDSFWASIFVGRSVATVAELCFMTQLVLTGRGIARALGGRTAFWLSTLPLPLIAIAETSSWYAVLTTNYVGNFIEESLWTLSGLLFAVSLALLLPSSRGRLRRLLAVAAVGGVGYVTFMVTVDLRMYGSRLLADRLAGRTYLSLADGLHDVITRRVVTFAWSDWHEELAWMFLYFSVTVWFSMSLVGASRLWARESGSTIEEAAS